MISRRKEEGEGNGAGKDASRRGKKGETGRSEKADVEGMAGRASAERQRTREHRKPLPVEKDGDGAAERKQRQVKNLRTASTFPTERNPDSPH